MGRPGKGTFSLPTTAVLWGMYTHTHSIFSKHLTKRKMGFESYFPLLFHYLLLIQEGLAFQQTLIWTHNYLSLAPWLPWRELVFYNQLLWLNPPWAACFIAKLLNVYMDTSVKWRVCRVKQGLIIVISTICCLLSDPDVWMALSVIVFNPDLNENVRTTLRVTIKKVVPYLFTCKCSKMACLSH